METVEDQKQLAQSVYNKLTIIDPRCLLAGGTPRDWYFDKPAKDLDFYIQTPEDRRYYESSEIFERLGFRRTTTKTETTFDQYEKMPSLKRVWDFTFRGYHTPVQIMELSCEAIGEKELWFNGKGSAHCGERLPNVVREFNNTLSYGWSAYGLIHYPKDFLFSVEHQIIGYKYEAPDIEKLSEKFPNYQLAPMEDFLGYKKVIRGKTNV